MYPTVIMYLFFDFILKAKKSDITYNVAILTNRNCEVETQEGWEFEVRCSFPSPRYHLFSSGSELSTQKTVYKETISITLILTQNQ